MSVTMKISRKIRVEEEKQEQLEKLLNLPDKGGTIDVVEYTLLRYDIHEISNWLSVQEELPELPENRVMEIPVETLVAIKENLSADLENNPTAGEAGEATDIIHELNKILNTDENDFYTLSFF